MGLRRRPGHAARIVPNPITPPPTQSHSAKGSMIFAEGRVFSVPAARVGQVVDTTGAGDLYAAGFLQALTRGDPLARCGRIASLAAAEAISHYGARPEADLKQLVREKLG